MARGGSPTHRVRVLVLPGLAVGSLSFRRVLSSLSSRGVHATALDLPGQVSPGAPRRARALPDKQRSGDHGPWHLPRRAPRANRARSRTRGGAASRRPEWRGSSEEVRRLPMLVLWSGSWSDMWIDEGKKVAAALPDAKFVYHSGGRWPQVTYHPLDVLRLRLAVQSGHSTLSQVTTLNEGICPEKYKNRRETSLAIALLSATFATLMCYPLDTVSSQMQMKGTPHNTFSDAIPGIVECDGLADIAVALARATYPILF
ncbi:unnamed protein product [Miscanthus lutarioriparius]|uniref:Uncharacterized protein n=1 Tax=Miscanthus lutarioriparius TaxID=422564 RepID=A0A811RKG0_9POAL|nr:unnamed protein product [Miscanthus lutarioriparius]